jgi:hypothetical protein
MPKICMVSGGSGGASLERVVERRSDSFSVVSLQRVSRERVQVEVVPATLESRTVGTVELFRKMLLTASLHAGATRATGGEPLTL